ncbi:hypothetical protein K502DRAFT_368948 [Neoconidiobolus thromboides FSU 785]|nr:hypothetical protein K502DRAFT_368948 [Neoconidiobolus thromboides FSU 785]
MILTITINQQSILFKHIALLSRVKKLTVSVNDPVDLDHFVNLLDPYKLKVLKIKCISTNLNGLGKLKELFEELKKLIVISEAFSIPSTLNNNSNFQSLETLKIEGNPTNTPNNVVTFRGFVFKRKLY